MKLLNISFLTIIILSSVVAIKASTTSTSTAWSRYQLIVDKAPFGRNPQPGDSDYVDPTSVSSLDSVTEGPSISETIKITMISIYDGKPAVGFVDNTTKKSYYLFEGDVVDGYEIISVNPTDSSARIKKDDREETLRVGGAAAPDKQSATTVTTERTPAITFASKHKQKSYSDLQRERDELRRKKEAQQLKDEEERKRDRQSGEEIKKKLREYNLDLIRSGRRPSVSFELTPDEVKQLASEGFDVSSDDETEAQ